MGQPYKQLAQFYDAIFTRWRAPTDDARNAILSRVLPAVSTACDLACGTGTTAVQLASLGIQVCGVDLSPDMCRLARARAKAEGLRIRVFQADMRTFRLPAPVDLITCENDALNHIPKPGDLSRVARAVYRALNPGGAFYFDVNNAEGFRSYWIGNICFERPGVFVVMRNGHSDDARAAWSNIDWFVARRASWVRFQERVDEVSWPGDEIRDALANAGFTSIRHFDPLRFYPKNPFLRRGCRSVWLARKPQQ